MQLRIIRIGKSKGIQLPASVIKKYRIEDRLKLILAHDHFILKPKTNARRGWAKIFEKAGLQKQTLLIPDVFDDENL